jgi:hypothetical protein
MRRRRLVATVLAACSSLAVLPAHAAGTTAPSLRLVTLSPLTLRGTGFAAREQVRVTLTVRVNRVGRTLQADSRGRFTYRPRTLIVIDPCRGTIVVRAVGASSGRQATWKRACRPPDTWP